MPETVDTSDFFVSDRRTTSLLGVEKAERLRTDVTTWVCNVRGTGCWGFNRLLKYSLRQRSS